MYNNIVTKYDVARFADKSVVVKYAGIHLGVTRSSRKLEDTKNEIIVISCSYATEKKKPLNKGRTVATCPHYLIFLLP